MILCSFSSYVTTIFLVKKIVFANGLQHKLWRIVPKMSIIPTKVIDLWKYNMSRQDSTNISSGVGEPTLIEACVSCRTIVGLVIQQGKYLWFPSYTRGRRLRRPPWGGTWLSEKYEYRHRAGVHWRDVWLAWWDARDTPVSVTRPSNRPGTRFFTILNHAQAWRSHIYFCRDMKPCTGPVFLSRVFSGRPGQTYRSTVSLLKRTGS